MTPKGKAGEENRFYPANRFCRPAKSAAFANWGGRKMPFPIRTLLDGGRLRVTIRPMSRYALVLVLLTLAIAGCRNAPEEARNDLRRDVRNAEEGDREAMRMRLRVVLVGDAENAPDGDPHLRAAAVQGLGDLGDPADSGVILDRLLGPLADENVLVRIECAIALGKLGWAGRWDQRRQDVILSLRNRIAFERDEIGRPFETEYLVRSAMVNTLIAIGGRDAAAALHDVATRVYSDLESVQGSLYTSATDQGLLDRCFQGLAELTGTPEEEAARNRFESDDLVHHIDWWNDRIADMPE